MKPCAYCSEPMEQKHGEKDYTFEHRIYCNRKCHNQQMRSTVRTCATEVGPVWSFARCAYWLGVNW